jgi:hypothetical protein
MMYQGVYMHGQYLKLVEETIKKVDVVADKAIIKEEKAEPLAANDQKSFFLGWLFAHTIEEPDYMEKMPVDIKQDFIDDYSQIFDEETLEIDEDGFSDLMKSMTEKIAAMEDDTDEEVPEPTDDNEEQPEELVNPEDTSGEEQPESIPAEPETTSDENEEEDDGEIQKV